MPADIASPAPEISSLPASNAPSEPVTIGRTTRRRPSPPTSSKTPANLVQAASPADDSSAAGKTGTESTKPDEAPIAGDSTSALKAFQELQEWHMVKMRPFNPGKAADARGHHSNMNGGGKSREQDVRIRADITAAPRTGEYAPQSSNWSAPSAIEARMLGIADSGGDRRFPPELPIPGRTKRRNSDGALPQRSGSEANENENDALNLPRNSALASRLPQEIIDLILKLSRTHGRAQAAASERVRQLVHNKAISGLIAKESWALDIMAQVLLAGDNDARTSCCACFRHLALEDDGCGHMITSSIVLNGLVTALQLGDDSAKQKAAAALGNLAWRSEETRAAICRIDGVVPGLLELLRGDSVRSKESALAALSNITLSGSCTAAVSTSMEALGVLCDELLLGTEKGQLRAAGIVRNLALDKTTRGSLLGFPGLVPSLEQVRRETSNTETMQRVESALDSLRSVQACIHYNGYRNGKLA